MKVFLPNEELDTQIKKLIRSFRKQMDGETADQMIKRGIKYKLNFGINLVHLREKARTLPEDIELADRLWHRQVRETMILATLIAPKQEMTKEMALEWAGMIDNCELVEQTALNLFSKLPFSAELVEEWLTDDNGYLRALGYYTLGWMYRFGAVPEGLKALAVSKSLSEKGEEDIFCLYRGISHLYRQMLRTDSEAVKKCEELISAFEKKQNKNLDWVVSEIRSELEFM